MKKTIRVGIVGTGFAGDFHERCLRRVHGVDVEITGVTSLRKSSRDAFGAQRNIPVFDTVEEMLPHVDLLDVCSPPCIHEENIILAAKAGKHIICEKPLTGSFGPEDAENFYGNKADKLPMLREVIARLGRIRQAVEDAGVSFGYAENFVYAPGIQKEREILEKTKCQILRMTGEESHNGSDRKSVV